MTLIAYNTERIRITSGGLIKILGDGQNDGFYLSNKYGQAGIFGGMYYNGSAWVRAASGSRLPAGMYVNTGGHIVFLKAGETSGTSATVTESVRIDSSGRVLIGTTTEGRATYGEHLTIAGSGHCGMTIRSGTTSYGILHFSDGTSGADEYSGMVEYLQGTNRMRLFAGGKYNIVLNGGGSTEINHNENKKLETTSTGVSVTGQIDVGTTSILSSGDISMGDSDILRLGAGDDLQISHIGTKSYIKDTGTGSLRICSDDFRVYNAADDEYMIKAAENAAVELYYNGEKMFDTQGDGCNIYDNDSNVNLYFRTSGGSQRGHIYADTGNHLGFKTTDNEWGIYCQAGAETALYHDGNYVYDTRTYGAKYHTTGGLVLPVGTTGQRTSAANGMVRANTTTNNIEGYIDGQWKNMTNDPFSASGGSESTTGGYKYHTFTSSGTFTVNNGTTNADILIVAGGGGGGGGTGYMHGGGGGAGGMIELTAHSIASGSYSISIGAGGGNNSNGSNTTAFSNTAIGGGDGGEEANGTRSGDSGGSGGGASYTGSGGSGTSGQGQPGGSGVSGGYWATGGGGGKIGNGGHAGNNSNAGAGGAGKAWNGTTYAGGGGGCTSGGGNPASGGAGGGGNGALNAANHGTANTGGGGGASDRPSVGGNGGSGIVIIKYSA